MPFIHTSFSKKINEEQKKQIVSEVGKCINILPRKTQSVLMQQIDDDKKLYFRGVAEDCVFINVHLYKSAPLEAKGEFARKFVDLIYNITKVEKKNIYLCYSEYDNWVINGDII